MIIRNSLEAHLSDNNSIVSIAEGQQSSRGNPVQLSVRVVKFGTVVGASDATGGYPSEDPQRPENMAATIYQALGIPPTAAWRDVVDRPNHIYHGEPIGGLV